jgi:hypothetical protein
MGKLACSQATQRSKFGQANATDQTELNNVFGQPRLPSAQSADYRFFVVMPPKCAQT